MNVRKWILIASMVIGMSLSIGVASASAMLSYVGPTLSSNPKVAKVQVETMLHHDSGVQKFYARELRVHKWEVAKAEVAELKFGYCVIGTKKCPFNTGKNGAGEVVKTNFRMGERRKVAYVKLVIGKQEYWVTIEAPCVNLLSGGKPLSRKTPPVPVSPKKPIIFKLVSVSYSVSTSTSSAKATCPAGTVEAVSGAGAEAKSEAEATHKFYRQGRHSWGQLYKQIKSISTTTYTSTGTGVSVTCVPSAGPPPPPGPPTPPPPAPEPPKIKNVYQIQETRAGEKEIVFYADAFRPAGDGLIVTFETVTGWFQPYKFEVPTYGTQTHFVSEYSASSDPGFDEVCVTALDTTTYLEAKECQTVEVQPVPEPPS